LRDPLPRVCRAESYATKPIPRPRNYKEKTTTDVTSYLLLVIPVASFALGTWQVKRKKWKDDLIESLMLKTNAPPVPLPESDAEVANLEFRKVKVKGEFLHNEEIFLGPRSCLIDGDAPVQTSFMATSPNGTSGYHIVTPFVLSDTHEKILVNRGWVPLKEKSAEKRQRGQVTGEVELVGVVRSNEPKPPFAPINKLDSRIWFARDIEGISAFLGTRPVFIDATVDSTVPGGPIGGQTRATLRNAHLSYVLTWYSVALCTGIMWWSRYRR